MGDGEIEGDPEITNTSTDGILVLSWQGKARIYLGASSDEDIHRAWLNIHRVREAQTSKE
jgi:hypothetical protein